MRLKWANQGWTVSPHSTHQTRYEGPDWIQTTNHVTSTLCFVTDDRYSPCPQYSGNVPGSDTMLFSVDISNLLYNFSLHSLLKFVHWSVHAAVRRKQTCGPLGLIGNWEFIYFRRIPATALFLWVVLDVSTADAVLVFLHKDLLTAQTSTAQLPVHIIGLCRKHNYCMHSYILDQWSLTWGSWRCFRGSQIV